MATALGVNTMPFVRATCDFETATHCVRKGQIVDLPADQIEFALKRGDAVRISTEDGIASLAGTENAVAANDISRKVR